jgi:protein-tyrosine phosphatase
MIDLHAHILPGVDDGPADAEESLDMIRMAAADGIHTVCATPHLLERPTRQRVELFTQRLFQLQEQIQAKGFGVQLVLGAEVYFQTDIEQVLDYPALSINGTGRYLLIEFPMQGIPQGAENVIFNLVMSGLVPIVAHPERNLSVLKDEDALEPFVHSGALLQVNAGSLEGHFGRRVKKCAHSLLRKGLVHLIGSDAHDAVNRPIRLRPAVEIASGIIGQEAAQALVSRHPRCILSGQPLPVSGPADSGNLQRNLLKKIWRGISGT